MRLVFIIVTFILLISVNSQCFLPLKMFSKQEIEYTSKDISETEEPFNICIFPDEPTIDFGKWTKYLTDSLVLNDASVDTIPPGRYTVFVQFVVGKNGELTNVLILKEPGHGLGERVKNTISNCHGIWKPVIGKNGKVVLSYRKQPITFVIEMEDECEKKLPAEAML